MERSPHFSDETDAAWRRHLLLAVAKQPGWGAVGEDSGQENWDEAQKGKNKVQAKEDKGFCRIMSSLRNTKQQGGEVHWISHNQWQGDASSLVAIEASLRLLPHVLTSCVLSLMGWQENAATIRVTCRIFKIKLFFFSRKQFYTFSFICNIFLP